MNGKMHSDSSIISNDNIRADVLNPFVHKLELDTTYDKIKTAIFTVVLLPFRVIVICYLSVAAWFLACFGLYGLTEHELRTKPMTGWRRALRPAICTLMKMAYLAGGMAISVRGKQATRSEAPILVVAPHSSFLDSCIVYAAKMASILVRTESMDNYVGKLINYTQPVYVWRDDPNSRQNTIKEIIERATSPDPDWPQILIFPEGTCTNRSCLITFKPGGFYPGVPVQPVTIRYPNHLDTVTWTWEGPGALKLLWLTLTQVHSTCEIEFLPVYHPSEEEKKDAKLYARNVRDVMAKSLGVPVLDYTYDDCRLMCRAKQLNIPGAVNIVEVQKLRNTLGLDSSQIELHIINTQMKHSNTSSDWIDCLEFARRLGIKADDPTTQKLFSLYQQKQSGLLQWRDYLMSAVFICLSHTPVADILNYGFKVYDTLGTGRITMKTFVEAAMKGGGLCQEDAENLFRQADTEEKGFMTPDEFFTFAQKRADCEYLFKSH